MTAGRAIAAEEASAALLAVMGRPGASFESRIAGTSMAPTIPDGAAIRVRPLGAQGAEAGEVLACVSRGGTLFAHRAVRQLRRAGIDWTLTVGDGWILCDSPTPAGRIVGVVHEFEAGAGWQPVGPAAARGPIVTGVSRASVAFVAAMLRLHPVLAQHLAGGCLHVGARLKALRRRLRRG